MGMFDWYRPAGELRCPIDGHLLSEWQGKDGPCALFLWQEGADHPIDQLVDEEVRLLPEEWLKCARTESSAVLRRILVV